MEEKEVSHKKSNTVLLTIIAVATLLVAVIGATFAYFSVTVTGNDTATSVIVKTAQLGISYDSGQAITGENIIPGWTANKTFTVTNTGEVDITYKVKWTNVTNDFANPEQLKYAVAGTVTTGNGTAGTKAEAQAPTAAGDIVTGIVIEPGAVHTYVLTMSFPDTSSDQNTNQNKTFMGKIEVETENIAG